VAAARERCLEPCAQDVEPRLAPRQPSPQGKDVGVVVLAAHARGEDVAAEGRPDPRDLVGSDGHADARAAHEETPIDLANGDGLGDLGSVVGVVDGVGAVGAEVQDLVAGIHEPGLEGFLELPAGVIGPKGNREHRA